MDGHVYFMIRVPFQELRIASLVNKLHFIFFFTKNEIKLYGMELEFIFSHGAGLQNRL